MTRKTTHDGFDASQFDDDSHTEAWRVHGNNAQMIDTSMGGQLSAATDDGNVCAKAEPGDPEARSDGLVCKPGPLSGARDGTASSRRSARRLAEHARTKGFDIEGPEGVNGRITQGNASLSPSRA